MQAINKPKDIGKLILSHITKLWVKTLNSLRVQKREQNIEAVTSSLGRLTAIALFYIYTVFLLQKILNTE